MENVIKTEEKLQESITSDEKIDNADAEEIRLLKEMDYYVPNGRDF